MIPPEHFESEKLKIEIFSDPHGPRMNQESQCGPTQGNASVVSDLSRESSEPPIIDLDKIDYSNDRADSNQMEASDKISKEIIVIKRLEGNCHVVKPFIKRQTTKESKIKAILHYLCLSNLIKKLRRGGLIQKLSQKNSSLKEILFKQRIIKFIQILRNQASLRDIKKPTGRAISLINDLSYDENSNPITNRKNERYSINKSKSMVKKK